MDESKMTPNQILKLVIPRQTWDEFLGTCRRTQAQLRAAYPPEHPAHQAQAKMMTLAEQGFCLSPPDPTDARGLLICRPDRLADAKAVIEFFAPDFGTEPEDWDIVCTRS